MVHSVFADDDSNITISHSAKTTVQLCVIQEQGSADRIKGH